MDLLIRSIAIPLCEACLLASTVEVSNSVNRWFRRSGSLSENLLWGTIALAIVALWVGLYFWDRARKPKKKTSQDREGLFNQLCDLHKLSKNDRQLLKQAARSQRIDPPALAFVNPRILLKFAEEEPQATLELKSLIDRLFGESLVQDVVTSVGKNAS